MSGNAADASEPTKIQILPASHWAAQQPEEDDVDADATSVVSSTTSLSESIMHYRELYGRTYHSEIGNAQYWAANDQKQKEVMDILHHLHMLLFDGKIYQAPLARGIKKVVDVGTGTGNWALDFADEFPECEVIGTDISPIQPSWVPPNVKFEIEDCTQTWSYPSSSLDYVHIRWLIGSVPDWGALFAEAYRVLKPGGWLESVEPSDRIEGFDGTVKPTDALGQWHQLFRSGGKVIGRDFDLYDRGTQKKAFEEAGFEQIQSKNVMVPLSQWPASPKQKEIGMVAQAHFTHDTEGFVLFVAATQGWKPEEVQAYIKLVHQEVKLIKKRAQYPWRVVWGRKPKSEK